jgi:hypothetical protein
MAGGFRVVGRTDRFAKDYQKLDAQQRQAVTDFASPRGWARAVCDLLRHAALARGRGST